MIQEAQEPKSDDIEVGIFIVITEIYLFCLRHQ